jgi:hypothetical protein
MKNKELLRVVAFRVPLVTYKQLLEYAHRNDILLSTLIRRIVLHELPFRS